MTGGSNDTAAGATTPADATPADATPAPATEAPTQITVEALVRAQLSKALGGRRGTLESAVPTIGFTASWVLTHDLQFSVIASGAVAAILLIIRLVQRSNVQFVLNSVIGIGIGAVFALRSGQAENVFLPGLIYNSVYAIVLATSALVRWPVVGFMIGSVTGDPTGWHRDRRLVTLCTRLTWILAVPCILRVLVQGPLWATEHATALGVTKLAMGWPLQVAALATMAWLLSRDSTPITVKKQPATAIG